jgi:DNA polymerase (family 10)
MTKSDIVKLLDKMATLMEFHGMNTFKVRAFKNGADIIKSLEEDLETLVKEKSLTSIKGVGKGLESVITQLVEHGISDEFEALKKEIPESLFDLLKIQGLGAKKVKSLYDMMEIKSIGELEYACKENRLVELKGFGEKTQKKNIKKH